MQRVISWMWDRGYIEEPLGEVATYLAVIMAAILTVVLLFESAL